MLLCAVISEAGQNTGSNIEVMTAISPGTFIKNTIVKGKRVRKNILPGWSAKVNEAVWNTSRLPCVWSFKQAIWRMRDVRVDGHCIVCKALFNAIWAHGAAEMNVQVTNYRSDIAHDPKKKRRYRKLCDMDKVVDKLKDKSAYVVRTELADKKMEVGDSEPPQLPSNNALRIIKHNENVKNLPKEQKSNAASRIMSLEEEFPDCIKKVGMKPFFVMYSTPMQEAWYEVESRVEDPVIIFDASGFGLLSSEKKAILMYQMMAAGRTKFVPIAQMLSEDQSGLMIYFWLITWLKVNKKPKEAYMDEGAALLAAAVMAFTSQKTTVEYVSACWDCWLHGARVPECYIRIDRSHFIRTLFRNKALKNTDSRKRSVYLNAFGFLIQCDDFDMVKEVVQSIFIICRNKYHDDAVKDAAHFLKSLKEGSFEFPEQSENIHSITTEQFEAATEKLSGYRTTPIYAWLMAIYNDIEPNGNLDDSAADELAPNLFFAPELEKFLIFEFFRMPLWGNIMMKKFKSKRSVATSSGCEADFRKKKSLFRSKKTKRPDVFVRDNLNQLKGVLKLDIADQKYINATQKSNKIKRSLSLSDVEPVRSPMKPNKRRSSVCNGNSEMYSKENWKNKAPPSPLKLQLKRSRASILNFGRALRTAPLIKNGYTEKLENRRVVTMNTCALDSLFFIYAHGYLNNEKVKQHFDKEESMFAMLVRNACAKSNEVSGVSVYEQRNKLLTQIYTKYFKAQILDNENVTFIDCQTAIAFLFDKLAANDNSVLNSMEHTKTCVTCDKNQIKPMPLVPLNINGLNLAQIQESVLCRTSVCKTCKGETLNNCKTSLIVAFEVDANPSPINSVQPKIVLNQTPYKLFGVIQHKTNHFTAHCVENNGYWWTYDDLQDDTKRSRKTCKKAMKIVMLFYIVDDNDINAI